jgi:hydrogenase/urease accessory protein HupE
MRALVLAGRGEPLTGLRLCAFAAVIVLALPARATAHPAPFSYLDIRLADTGVDGTLTVHDFDVAHDLGVDPPDRLQNPAIAETYRTQLTRLLDTRLNIVLDGARVTPTWNGLEVLADRQSLRLSFHLEASRPGTVRVETVLFPYDPVHQTFINVYEDGALRHQAIIDASRSTFDYYAGTWQGTAAVLAVFVPAGIEHILIGPDHILFLVALLLLGGSMGTLVSIVTAFTIGHSITLSLAALYLVSPPASLVEPAIALSIVFVGADNLLVQRDRRVSDSNGPVTGKPRDIRAWVAAVFGLVHGFGFASVLREFGLPISFNLGVEIGQIAIVLVVARLLALVSARSTAARRWVVTVGSIGVIAAGGYWFIERVWG